MIVSQLVLSIILFFSAFQAGSEKELQVVEDLKPQLKTFKESILTEDLSLNSRDVHLALDLSQHRGQHLLIESKKVFYLFVNSTFVLRHKGSTKLNADSLRQKYSNSIFISIYQKTG